MNIKHATIGVIGYGNFGKVICNNLFTENQVLLFSTKHYTNLPNNVSLASSIQEVVEKSDVIIPCVPIRTFEEVTRQICSYITPRKVVMDICSVKIYPVEIMQKYLPSSVQIIATHPMFGPNSIEKRNGKLSGLTMVMHNVSAQQSTYEELKNLIMELEINVVEISPDEHDQLSSQSQFFALCIGELAQRLHLHPTRIDTPGAEAIFAAMQYMGADRHIIEDMERYNPYSQKLLDGMIQILSSLKRGGQDA